MASFDIASKVDVHLVENALNVVMRELQNRYDFKGSHFELNIDKKKEEVEMISDSEMKINQIEELVITRSMRQNVDPKSFDFSGKMQASGNHVKKVVKLKNGIDRALASKIVKSIKASKIKVQTAIMDDIVRVNGKKIDDLQEVIQLLRQDASIEQPLQFINQKS